ncbi:MAG: hypothetical protein E7342_02625 [Clostridiales bacterium]|nr:hypothetical protein [Clostridiales bacterium]
MVYFYTIFFGLALLSTLALIFTKIYKKDSLVLEKITKILVIVFMSLHFLNLFLPDSLAMRTFDDLSNYVGGENIWFILIRWFNDFAFIAIPIALFFKNKTFIKFVSFFTLIISIVNASIFFKYIEVYTSTAGAGIMALRFFSAETKAFFINPIFRGIYFGIENYIQLMLSIFILLKNVKTIEFNKEIKEILKEVAVFFATLVSVIPIYAPQFLFKGYSLTTENVFTTFKMGEFFHIVWIIFIILEGIILTYIFKNKSKETKLILIYILTFSLILQYNQMFTGIGEITTHRMPFQLCNMAPLFILIMLLTKSEKVYHFTLVINAVGAIIAMVMCDTTPYGVTYIMNIHYIAEHTNVILIPILCATLRIFAPLKNKDVKHFIIGFTIYFLFILLVGGIFTGLKETTGNDYWNCNYLFMFNKEETMAIVGFVGPLFDMKIVIANFFTLSLTQLLVYLVFMGICTGAFFLMKLLLNKNTKKLIDTND